MLYNTLILESVVQQKVRYVVGVTREELERYLHGKGWVLDVRTRRSRGKLYAYAKRRQGERVITKYLCPEDKIDTLDEATIEQKLQ